MIDQSDFPEGEFNKEAEQPAMEFEHGFSLEYVIQIVRPGQGPHVMEVHLKGAQLQWPYVTQMDFVWDLANAYKHFFVRDWVMPYPEVRMLSRRHPLQQHCNLSLSVSAVHLFMCCSYPCQY